MNSGLEIKPNVFGDDLPPVDQKILTKRMRSLRKAFLALVQKHPNFSAYLEYVLRSMSSEANAALFIKLARWLENQTADFSRELDARYVSGELLEIFEVSLADLTQEVRYKPDVPGDSLPSVNQKALEPNIFGDSLPPVDQIILTKRARVFRRAFFAWVKNNPDFSAYLEYVLRSMSSEAGAVLFIKLARWLENQTADFSRELDAQYASGKLLEIFEVILAGWAQEVMLDITARKSRIKEVYVTQLFPRVGYMSIPINVIHQESHHANHVDMVYVCAMAAMVDAKRIFEFGTYRGQTTCGLAAVCPEARILTLNLPPDADPRYAPYIGKFISRSPDRDRIEQLFTDSRSFDAEPYRQSMDYIFIDGDHSYEMVKNDTEKAMQMLKPGGVIVWHDYAAKSPGVLQYLAEFSQERPLFRIRKTCLAVYVDGRDPETAELPPMEASLEDYGLCE